MTCDADPTVETGAAAVSMVTVCPVVTLAGLRAVWSVLVGLAVWTHTDPKSYYDEWSTIYYFSNVI